MISICKPKISSAETCSIVWRMLRFRVVKSVLIFILSASALGQDVYKSMAIRIMRLVSGWWFLISVSPCFSKEAWDSLEKPLGTFRTETFAECGEKCSELEGCGMIHFNRHDNRGYKWCTLAKVEHRELYFSLCPHNILRLPAYSQIIRSAKWILHTGLFLVR